MRIALIAHLRYPIREPFAGGVEEHTRLLATELAARVAAWRAASKHWLAG